jgi:hypothetical protein
MRDDSGQASLIKTILLLSVVALLLIDLGRPLVGKVSLDTRAHAAAAASADDWKFHRDEETARAKADSEAARDGSHVIDWSVRDNDGTVTVTLERTTPSWFFGKVFTSWYVSKATASERP